MEYVHLFVCILMLLLVQVEWGIGSQRHVGLFRVFFMLFEHILVPSTVWPLVDQERTSAICLATMAAFRDVICLLYSQPMTDLLLSFFIYMPVYFGRRPDFTEGISTP